MTSPTRLIDRYLRHITIERGLSDNTVAAYRRDLARYRAHLEAQGIDDVSAISDDVALSYLTALREEEPPLAPRSIARMLAAVRSFHRFALAEGEIAVDPTRELRPPKQPSRLPKALRLDEVEALLAAARGDDPKSLRDTAMLELLYATGARISEVCALNLDDIFEGDIVRLRGKGDKQRVVPVGEFARDALDSYVVRARPLFATRGTGTPALFLGQRGQRMSRQNAWLILQSIAERAGLRAHVSPHTLRHSFATHLLEGGADVRVVQELLGHASVSTTQIYTQVTADALRDMVAAAHPRASLRLDGQQRPSL